MYTIEYRILLFPFPSPSAAADEKEIMAGNTRTLFIGKKGRTPKGKKVRNG